MFGVLAQLKTCAKLSRLSARDLSLHNAAKLVAPRRYIGLTSFSTSASRLHGAIDSKMDLANLNADPTTRANYLQIASTHVAFDWNVNFDKKIIQGSATHSLTAQEDAVQEVIFDTSSLEIEKVEVEGKSAEYKLGEVDEVVGSALHISLPSPLKKGANLKVVVHYKTSPDSTALQWLQKEETQGKSFPFLFSQCQPIYARSMAPLQDSNSVKVTYSASVTSVLPVLLSALHVSPPADGPPHAGKTIGKDAVTYTFNQPIPIPPYLIAIAVGNFRYRELPKPAGKTWTSGVWAEPELIDAAYWEFSQDAARFLATAETILPAYRFGIYDLLVLPPSFPYGGMENACCTFLTPTLLAGDRTLVDVVVHELTHSWFGNGVTHANAAHFWLNEGWTTYIERLLLQVLHGPAARGFSFVIGAKSLSDALALFAKEPRYQQLIIDYQIGENPDDAYSEIPYEKGANLLLHLERTIGGLDVFLPYVNDYVSTFMGKSITTEQWKTHLYAYYETHGGAEKINALNSIDWDAWFFGQGLKLPVEMEYDLSLAKQTYALAERWDASRSKDIVHLDFEASDLDDFNSLQKAVFLERLQSYAALPSSHITHLGTLYGLAASPNPELRFRFYEVSMLDPTSSAAVAFASQAAKWVVGADGTGIIKGRMKYCRPVFRAIYKTNGKLAVETFTAAKDAFHPVARRLIEKDMGLV